MHQLPHQELLPGSPAGCGCLAGQGGHRESQRRDISRVLQPPVPGAEKDRRPASNNRLVHTSRMRPARVGRPVRVTLDTGTVVSISKIMAHQCSGDAGRHQRHESFPSSSEIPAGSLDVRQRSHSCLPTSRTRGDILHSDAADVTPAEVVRSQGDNTGSPPSARSPQRPGNLAVQSRPDTEHGVDDGHGASPTSICLVG